MKSAFNWQDLMTLLEKFVLSRNIARKDVLVRFISAKKSLMSKRWFRFGIWKKEVKLKESWEIWNEGKLSSDLFSTFEVEKGSEVIRGRIDGPTNPFKMYPILFSGLGAKKDSMSSFYVDSPEELDSHECFRSIEINSFNKKWRKQRKSTGATFLNGEHYLVDVAGNLMKVRENGGLTFFIRSRFKRM